MRAIQQHIWYILLIIAIMLAWQGTEVAYSQANPNYRIEWSVLDAGGGERSSMNYRIWDSLGQPSGTVVSTSSNYIHVPGFYEDLGQSDPDPGSGPGPDPTSTPPPIPETGTLILFGTGLFGLFIFMRRRLRKRK
jgi:hypothetical protein